MMIKLILMAAVVLVLAVVVLFAVAAIRRSANRGANRGANRVPMLKKDDWSATIYSCAESRSEL